jgi:hypothetical protein
VPLLSITKVSIFRRTNPWYEVIGASVRSSNRTDSSPKRSRHT